MYNAVSGYHTFASPSIAVFPKSSPPGIPYISNPESTMYRQSIPASYPRGPSAFISSSPMTNRGFPRSGGVHLFAPQRPATVSSDGSSQKITDQPRNKDAVSSAVISTDDLISAVANEQPQQQAENLANTKEKTPMCLINELARFNKIQHQYCLTDEQGPAHKKTFFVKLKLGDQEFAASGASIKKAQHAAASVALEQTRYPHPVPKKPVSPSGDCNQTKASNSSVTPTVELNALAMKRGELAVYRPIERKPGPAVTASYYSQPFGVRGGGYYNQRYRYPRPPHRFSVALKVGEREFIGEGETLQAARHSAASMALKVLKNLPLPTQEPAAKRNSDDETVNDEAGSVKGGGNNDSLKSEISLVHEIALKRSYTVEFEIAKESGPPHMRTFVTRCKCGELTAEGEGSSKKISKKRAAEKMVEELRKLPQLPPVPPGIKPKKNVKPKQTKNLIKNVLNNCSAGVNPISRLIQIQQAKKEKEPTFTTVEEKGLPRAREFHIQVTVGDNTCTGVGSNKRLAKRSAAEQMLQMLGYSLLAPQPSKPAIKSGSAEGRSVSPSSSSSPVGPSSGGCSGDKRVTFVEPEITQARTNSVMVSASARHGIRSSPQQQNTNAMPSETELTTRGSGSVNRPVSNANGARQMNHLSYLAKVLKYELLVSNYPKDEAKTEYLSVITIGNGSTTQFFNGTGPSIEAANDDAAHEALRRLSECGLGSQSQGRDGQGLASEGSTKHRLPARGEKSASAVPGPGNPSTN